MTKSDPQKDATVSEGLAKMREAADKLTEEEVAALAEKAKKAVTDAKKEAEQKR
ncbi:MULTISPECIES: hypothetical protein [unclassified Brenneria]|uniref:hypothetical protein n=1 Tax=unclassified Brenneria TaxID=2634434 RepID=UPI0029C51CA2|nr:MULTISPECIES: hypothetical protein [unclassified Brenneria]MDX5627644.1 hypothetical protein [Brenneria sp. L3-3Z]MDX5695265.1 hypothetical protein [Brenneria sp. L4-2C]